MKKIYLTAASIVTLSLAAFACSNAKGTSDMRSAGEKEPKGSAVFDCVFYQLAEDGHEDYREAFQLRADQDSAQSVGTVWPATASIGRIVNQDNSGPVPAVLVSIKNDAGIEVSTDFEEELPYARISMRVSTDTLNYTNYLSCHRQ